MYHSPNIEANHPAKSPATHPAAADRRSAPARIVSRRGLEVGVLLLAVLFMILNLVAAVRSGAAAFAFPYQLDFGEGVVWQQLRAIAAGRGYAPLDGFPDFVFNYPPLFHAVTCLVSAVTGWDQLAAGRFVSLLATGAAALLAGLIAAALVEDTAGQRWRPVTAAVTALLSVTLAPVQGWAALMRVDMLALALALAGLLFTIRALSRPAWIYGAGLAFTAAVFTKQTMVAAPAAAFLVLLLAHPALAFRGIATCLVAGLGTLGAWTVATDGNFVRHLFLYNINRLYLEQLRTIVNFAALHVGVLGFAILSVATLARSLPWSSVAALRQTLRTQPVMAARAMAGLYFLLASVMTLLVAKSGAGPNYLVEWLVAAAVLAGFEWMRCLRAAATPPVRRTVLVLLGVAVAAQSMVSLQVVHRHDPSALRAVTTERQRMQAAVASANGPVLSDEMTLPLRSNRDVLWEAAIFTELGHAGRYDLAPFIAHLKAGRMALIITEGQTGERPFDDRYPPDIARVIDQAYPLKERVGDYVIHRRANVQPARP